IVSSFCLFFFFSSRRRHTRFSRDWSSDVCSSDLVEFNNHHLVVRPQLIDEGDSGRPDLIDLVLRRRACIQKKNGRERLFGGAEEIGRASCRERVEVSVVGESGKN